MRKPAGRYPPRRTAFCTHDWRACAGRLVLAGGSLRAVALREGRLPTRRGRRLVQVASAVSHSICPIFARLLCHIVERPTDQDRDLPAPHAAGANGSIWNLSARYARLAAAQVAHAQHSLHGCIVVACWQACEKKYAGHGKRWSERPGWSEAHARGACGNVARVRRRAAKSGEVGRPD